jgi:hypothetical protein
LCFVDHHRIEVERDDVFGVKAIEEYLDADATSAADLEDALPREASAGKIAEPVRFSMVLVGGAYRGCSSPDVRRC